MYTPSVFRYNLSFRITLAPLLSIKRCKTYGETFSFPSKICRLTENRGLIKERIDRQFWKWCILTWRHTKEKKERRIKWQFLCSCQWVGFITLHRILIVKMVFHNSTRNGWWTASSASQDGDSFVKSVQAIISVEPAPRSIEVSLSIFLISLSVSVCQYEFKFYRHDGSYGSIVSQLQD